MPKSDPSFNVADVLRSGDLASAYQDLVCHPVVGLRDDAAVEAEALKRDFCEHPVVIWAGGELRSLWPASAPETWADCDVDDLHESDRLLGLPAVPFPSKNPKTRAYRSEVERRVALLFSMVTNGQLRMFGHKDSDAGYDPISPAVLKRGDFRLELPSCDIFQILDDRVTDLRRYVAIELKPFEPAALASAHAISNVATRSLVKRTDTLEEAIIAAIDAQNIDPKLPPGRIWKLMPQAVIDRSASNASGSKAVSRAKKAIAERQESAAPNVVSIKKIGRNPRKPS